LGLTSVELHGHHCWAGQNDMAAWAAVASALGHLADADVKIKNRIEGKWAIRIPRPKSRGEKKFPFEIFGCLNIFDSKGSLKLKMKVFYLLKIEIGD
jgi:hypothetical protein